MKELRRGSRLREEIGFCSQPWEDQRELVKEYAEMQRQLNRSLQPSGEQK